MELPDRFRRYIVMMFDWRLTVGRCTPAAKTSLSLLVMDKVLAREHTSQKMRLLDAINDRLAAIGIQLRQLRLVH
jgi:hypothetical protein